MNSRTDVNWTPLPVPLAVEDPSRIPKQRYYDPDFYALEAELFWPRVWQMACRLEEIPKAGDFVEYEILDQSIIVVRVDADTVRAYHNACRHRGVKLVEGNGNRRTFVCPFHGWCWGIDGRNTFVLRPEAFADENMAADDLQLVPVKCELWGGCAWINLDDDAPPLRDWMEPFASIYDAWKVESLRVEWWQSCRLPVNWKLATAAFMEGYHVPQTHPQLLPSAQNGSPSEAVHPVVASSLYFMRTLGDGMGGMTHENDIRIAEGMQTIHAAIGSGGGDGGLAQRAQRRGGEVASGPGERDARPERPDPPRDHRRDQLRLPAPLHPAHVQQRLLVPDPSARSGGNSVRDLVADPDARRPLHRQADPAGADGARRPALAADPRSRLLQPATAAKRIALQGI